MSDQQEVPGPLDARQRYANRFEAIQTHLDNRQAQMHTAMPGIIEAYDPATMTATVRPALQAFHKQLDGTRVPLTIEAIRDVPVHFPAGGGFTLTFPVKVGDECLISFCERSIDNWHQHGGIQQPSDWRMHDITDAVAHVGLRSQPSAKNLAAHASNVQLRSDDGKTHVEIAGGGIVRILAPTAIELDTPVVRITGVIDVTNARGASGHVGTFNGTVRATVDVISNTVSGVSHIHTGVRAGGNTSGMPVP